jgi:hypothetical protein
VTAGATTKAREGQVAGENEKQGEEVLPPEWLAEMKRQRNEVADDNPRHDELLHQRIRLKGNGVEMEWGVAQAIVDVLRAFQASDTEAFATLVALVKPRGAKRPPGKVSRKALEALIENGPHIVNANGSVEEDYAKVLDAAYEETRTGEGVVLRDPVMYLSREWVEEWAPIDRKVQIELARITGETAIEAIRTRRGKRDGHPER